METCPVKINVESSDALFAENLPYDYETVYSLRRYNLLFRYKSVLVLAVLCPAVAVIMAVYKYYLLAILFAVLSAIILWSLFSIKKSSRRIYERTCKDEKLRLFTFYEDNFTVETEKSAYVLDYDRISSIITHDTYLMIFLNNGMEFAIPEKADIFGKAAELLTEKTKGRIHK